MQIKDRIEYKNKLPPLTFSEDVYVIEAVKQMAANDYGAVIVVDADNKPTGIVSERDFVKRLLIDDKDPKSTRLSDIMTRDIYVAKEEDDLLQWLRIMSNERFRHLPIVDDSGKILCMMSQGDFVSYTWPELLERVKETAAATLAPNYQIALIVAGLIIYAVIIPVLFHIFS